MFEKQNTSSTKILPFFPSALPDETIGSRVSRYHIRRGRPTAHATYHQLFDRGPFSLTTLVQPYLEKLAARLPGSPAMNLYSLQNDSTLLPLFQRFSGTRKATGHASRESDITSVELPRRIIGDSRLTHICTQCLVDDEHAHGCPYIHRSHQIPGVTACWKHATPLIDRCPSCRQPFAQPNQLILSAWLGCECGHSLAESAIATQASPSDIEVEFARFTRTLLESEHIQLKPSHLVQLYKVRAGELGFGWGGNRVNRQSLFAELEAFFGMSLLSRIDPAYRQRKTSGWFGVLHSSQSVETPLHRHLLFAFFLFREAALFLKLTQEFAEATKNSELLFSENNYSKSPNFPERDDATVAQEELMNEMVEVAQRYGYDTQQLWNHHVGSMKRLVKYLPNACELIDTRLKEAAAKKRRYVARTSRTKARDLESDVQWMEAIRASSAAIYNKEQRPFRVTMNQLVKTAKYCPKGLQLPTEVRFPLTRAAAVAHAESTWHFYARRILWTLQSLHDPETPMHKILNLARLELYKGKAVYEYFVNVRRCGGASVREVNAILASHGIRTDWKGPCPDKTFYRAGRGYQLRTSRRGPIGGRAGEWQAAP